MNNLETFIAVMAILLPILFICSTMVFAGLQQSKETHEVLYNPNTFTNSWWHFWLSIDIAGVCFLVIASAYCLFRSTNLQNQSWGFHLFIFLLILVYIFIAIYIIYLLINYWKYTKDVEIRFEPSIKTIFVRTHLKDYTLREEDIIQIDIYTNNRRQVRFLYYQFTLQNGERLILTDRTRGVYGILEYFKKIPTHNHTQLFPLIR